MDRPPRLLVWITLAVALIASIVVLQFSKSELPDSVQVNYKGHPTLGFPKARVHVVMFEEPKCTNCAEFSDTVFPRIKEEYIDTNKITYTVITASFLQGSMPAANALLCVYHSDPLYPNSELFFAYLHYMFHNQPQESQDWATVDNLVKMAQKTSPAINTDQLRKCVEMEAYRVKIEQNTEYGKQVMGGMIGTPTMFVNGIEVEELSYEKISELINKVLKHEGVY